MGKGLLNEAKVQLSSGNPLQACLSLSLSSAPDPSLVMSQKDPIITATCRDF